MLITGNGYSTLGGKEYMYLLFVIYNKSAAISQTQGWISRGVRRVPWYPPSCLEEPYKLIIMILVPFLIILLNGLHNQNESPTTIYQYEYCISVETFSCFANTLSL